MTSGAAIQAVIAGVIHGPGGDGLHGPDEYVDLDSLQTVTETLATTVINWCGMR